MNCDERTLRELLASVHAHDVERNIATKIANGEPVVFRFENDEELKVHTLPEAWKVLRERFGWKGTNEAHETPPDGGSS